MCSCPRMAASLQPIHLTRHAQPPATLGCPVLDGLLRGGIPCRAVTELTGEASAGKTQIALQSLLTVQLPEEDGGLAGKAVYIYTEGRPPVERLQSILANRFAGNPHVSLDNVMFEVRPVHSPDDLLRTCSQLESLLQQQAQLQQPAARKVRLVVIDSIGHVFRDALGTDQGGQQQQGSDGAGEDGAGEGGGAPVQAQMQHLTRRTAQLFTLSALLKRLAVQHCLAVLLTNQVADDLRGGGGGAGSGSSNSTFELGVPSLLAAGRTRALVSSGRRLVPALGLAWANCVNVRLFAARHCTWSGSTVRTLQVVFAPHLPPSYCCFRVQHDGVWGVDEDEGQQGQQQGTQGRGQGWSEGQQGQGKGQGWDGGPEAVGGGCFGQGGGEGLQPGREGDWRSDGATGVDEGFPSEYYQAPYQHGQQGQHEQQGQQHQHGYAQQDTCAG